MKKNLKMNICIYTHDWGSVLDTRDSHTVTDCTAIYEAVLGKKSETKVTHSWGDGQWPRELWNFRNHAGKVTYAFAQERIHS